jgi:hypothetical protein
MTTLDELVQMEGSLRLRTDELKAAWAAASKAVDDLPSDTSQEVITAACAAHHAAYLAHQEAQTAFYDVFEKLTRCLGCETWQLLEAAGDWIKDEGYSWCPNCAHSCKGCDRLVCNIDDEGEYCPDCRQQQCRVCAHNIEADEGDYCKGCRPCECGECDVVGGTCEAQSAKYEAE